MGTINLGRHANGPENRVVSAKVGNVPTVWTNSMYASAVGSSSVLSISVSENPSESWLYRVVAVDGSPTSKVLRVTPVRDVVADRESSVQRVLGSIRMWAEKSPDTVIPDDLYNSYISEYIPYIVGRYVGIKRTTVRQTVDGDLNTVANNLPSGLCASPAYGGPSRYTYNGSTTLLHWGDYDFDRYGIAEAPITHYLKGTITSIRYSTPDKAFVVGYASRYVEAGLRYAVNTDVSSSHSSVSSSVSTVERTYYRKEDKAHVAAMEAVLPKRNGWLASPSSGYVRVVVDTEYVASHPTSLGEVPCVVHAYKGGYHASIAGTIDLLNNTLTTALYNPLEIQYPRQPSPMGDMAEMQEVLENYFYMYHTEESLRLPEGFYYGFPSTSTLEIYRDAVIAIADVLNNEGVVIGSVVAEFMATMPIELEQALLVCLEPVSEAALAQGVIHSSLFPTYIQDAGMSDKEVYLAVRESLRGAVLASSELAVSFIGRAYDMPLVVEGRTLFDVVATTQADDVYSARERGIRVAQAKSDVSRTSQSLVSSLEDSRVYTDPTHAGDGTISSSSSGQTVGPLPRMAWSTLDTLYVSSGNGLKFKPADGTVVLSYDARAYTYSGSSTSVVLGGVTRSSSSTSSTSSQDDFRLEGSSLVFSGSREARIVPVEAGVTSRYITYRSNTNEKSSTRFDAAYTQTFMLAEGGNSIVLLSVSYPSSTVVTTYTQDYRVYTCTYDIGSVTTSTPSGALDTAAHKRVASGVYAVGVAKERIGYIRDVLLYCEGAAVLARYKEEEEYPEYTFPNASAPTDSYVSSDITFERDGVVLQACLGVIVTSPIAGWAVVVCEAPSHKPLNDIQYISYLPGLLYFPVPEVSSSLHWYVKVTAYVVDSQHGYQYGPKVYTSKVFNSQPSADAGILAGVLATDTSKSTPSGDVTDTYKIGYVSQSVANHGIGVGHTAELWSVGMSSRAYPFIWFSNIEGAEGYCVGFRTHVCTRLAAASYTLREATSYPVLVKSIAALVASLTAEAAKCSDQLYAAEVREVAYSLSRIQEAVYVVLTEAERAGDAPLSTELVYEKFVKEGMNGIRLLRNDFATPDMLFSIHSARVGCGFLRQVALPPVRPRVSSLWESSY